MMKRMKALQNKDVTDKYDDSVDEKKKKYVEKVAYSSASKYPRDVKNVSVYVDEDKEVVFLPINSVPVRGIRARSARISVISLLVLLCPGFYICLREYQSSVFTLSHAKP